MVSVRTLGPEDAELFHTLRLRALREHPDAFGESVEEREQRTIEETRERFINETNDENYVLGAFLDGELVGKVGFYRHPSLKTRHRGRIWGMYIASEVRRQGIAVRLIETVIERTRTLDGVEQIGLFVTVGNQAARDLYLAVGFEPVSVEPRVLKVGNKYYDMELMTLSLEDYL